MHEHTSVLGKSRNPFLFSCLINVFPSIHFLRQSHICIKVYFHTTRSTSTPSCPFRWDIEDCNWYVMRGLTPKWSLYFLQMCGTVWHPKIVALKLRKLCLVLAQDWMVKQAWAEVIILRLDFVSKSQRKKWHEHCKYCLSYLFITRLFPVEQYAIALILKVTERTAKSTASASGAGKLSPSTWHCM